MKERIGEEKYIYFLLTLEAFFGCSPQKFTPILRFCNILAKLGKNGEGVDHRVMESVPFGRRWEEDDSSQGASLCHLPWGHYAYISLKCRQKRFLADNAVGASGAKMRLEIFPFFSSSVD